MIITLLICTVLLLSCSGKDKLTVDKDPPAAPILLPHLGDLGDITDNTMHWNDDNNGIDAVPDDNWLRISWDHLLDSDLDYIKIFRFDEFNPVPALIDTMQYDPGKDYFLDSKTSLSTNVRYSYYIEVVDNAGNSAQSDTVSYSLLSKQILVSPGIDETVNPSNVSFQWQKSGNVSWFRLLVFTNPEDVDEERQYLWSQDVQVDTEVDFFEVIWPNNPPQQYTGKISWRVDAFDWDSELQIFIGSESNERPAYLASKK